MDSKLALYIVKRLTLAVITIFLIITITFFVMHEVPGGPFLIEKSADADDTAALEAKYGLDKPKSEQYVTYLKGIMKGDFGPSIKQRGREVTAVIMQGFKVSFKLGGTAAVIALCIGTVLGSVAAIFHNKTIDKIIMVVTTGLVAMPSFIIATLLLLVFCVWMGIFPANGNEPGGNNACLCIDIYKPCCMVQICSFRHAGSASGRLYKNGKGKRSDRIKSPL